MNRSESKSNQIRIEWNGIESLWQVCCRCPASLWTSDTLNAQKFTWVSWFTWSTLHDLHDHFWHSLILDWVQSDCESAVEGLERSSSRASHDSVHALLHVYSALSANCCSRSALWVSIYRQMITVHVSASPVHDLTHTHTRVLQTDPNVCLSVIREWWMWSELR